MLNDDITALIDSISIPVITGALRCADEFSSRQRRSATETM